MAKEITLPTPSQSIRLLPNLNPDLYCIEGNIVNTNITGNISTNNIVGRVVNNSISGYKTCIVNIIPTPSPSPILYSSEANALFARMTVQPTTALKQLIDKTITDLKTAGIWDITDKLHKWDLHTEQASLLDWKNAAHDATNVDGAVFTPKYGVTTTQYVNYVDLNFIPSTDCINGTLNDFGFSIDDLTGLQTLGPNFGSYDKANTTFLGFRTMEIAAVRPWLWLNSKAQKVWKSNGGINLYYNERKDSSTVRIFRSATRSTFGTSLSVAMTDNKVIIGGYIASDGNIGAKNSIDTSTLWIGKSFTDEQRASWYEIINYWKANIGSTF